MAILDFIPLLGNIIDRILPDPKVAADAKLKMMEMAQNGQLEILHSETQLAQGQQEIDKVEAASSSTFVSGARPFIMWVCGVAMLYVCLLEPIGRFIACVMYGYKGAFPIIDTTITMQLLFGMLGLGAMRSYDKKNGTAS